MTSKQSLYAYPWRGNFFLYVEKKYKSGGKAGGDLSALSTCRVKSVMVSLILLGLKSPNMFAPFSVNQYN